MTKPVASDDREARRKYPDLLADLRDHVVVVAREAGLDDGSAEALGARVAERIRSVWGGQNIYVPKGSGFDVQARDLALWEHYNGANQAALCEQYGISLQHFYRIAKAMRRWEMKRKQRDLF